MKTINGRLVGEKYRVGIVVAKFNELVTTRLLEGCVSQLQDLGIDEDQIVVAKVPGAMEISRVAKKLGDSGQVDGLIALGAVIRGETSHYDYVCSSTAQGLSTLSLTGPVPVMFGVLTTDNLEQALSRSGGKGGNKGTECATGLIQLLSVEKQIEKIK